MTIQSESPTGLAPDLARTYDRISGQLDWLIAQGVDAERIREAVIERLRGVALSDAIREPARRNVVERLAVLLGPRGMFLAATWVVSGPLRLESALDPGGIAEHIKALRRLEVTAPPSSPAHASLRALLAGAAADIGDLWSDESAALGRRLAVFRDVVESDPGRALLAQIADEVAASVAATQPRVTSKPDVHASITRARALVGGAGLDVARTRLDPATLARALAEADGAVAADPNDVEAVLVRGQVHALIAADRALAERDLLRALELDAEEGRAHTALGNLARAAGDRGRADAHYAQAIASARPDPSAHFYRGVWRVEDGDVVGGEADGAEVVRAHPELPGGHWIVGRARFLRGDAEGALASFAAALAVDPDHAGTYLSRSDVFMATGQHARALADLDRAVALSDDATCRYNRGTAKLAMGELAGAEADFTAALDRNPSDVQALLNRGTVRLMLGRALDAEEDFRLAVGLAPSWPQAHAKLGLVLLQRGARRDAAVEIRAALEVAPPDWPSRAELAQLLATLG